MARLSIDAEGKVLDVCWRIGVWGLGFGVWGLVFEDSVLKIVVWGWGLRFAEVAAEESSVYPK